MEDFINELDLPFEGEMHDNQYIINLNNSDDFSKLFSQISMNNKLNLEDDSVATVNESEFRFTDGNYEILLKADYDSDAYQMIVEVK